MSISDIHRQILTHDIKINRPPLLKLASSDSVQYTQGEQSPSSTPKVFNYKTLRTFVKLQKKSLQEAAIIYRQLKTFELMPTIQEKYNLYLDDLLRLCQHVRIEEYSAGTIIYKKGDKTNHEAYLIISGEVQYTAQDLCYSKDKIIKKQNPNSTNFNTFQPFLSQQSRNQMKPRSTFRKKTMSSLDPKNLQIELTVNNEQFHDPWANKLYHADDFTPRSRESIKNCMKKMKGEYFGESALLYGVDRSETVIAATNCEFVVIDDLCILKANSIKEELSDAHKAILINLIPGIQDISSKSLVERIIQFFELVNLDRGAVITKQGELGKHIFLLHEGEIESYSKAPPSKELAHVFPAKKLEKHYRIKSMSEQVPIFRLTPGSFIGEEIIFEQEKSYHFSSKVVSAYATAFRIEKGKFVSKFPKEILENVKKMYYEKSKKNNKIEIDKMKLYNEEPESYLLKAYESDLNKQESTRFEKPKNVFNWLARPNPSIMDESLNISMPLTARKARSAASSRSAIPSSSNLSDENKKELKKKFDEVQNRTMYMNYMSSDKTLKDLTVIQSSYSPDTRNINNAKEFKFFTKVAESRSEKIAQIMEMTNRHASRKPRAKSPLVMKLNTNRVNLERGTQTARDPRDCTLMEDLEYFYRKKFPFPTHDSSLINISNSVILQPKVHVHQPSKSPSRNLSDILSINTPFSVSRYSDGRSESTIDKTRHKSAQSRVKIKQMMPSFNKIKMKKPNITLDIFSSFSKSR